jgi:hypothetical protein
MNTPEQNLGELEKLMTLSLQKSGDILPWCLDDLSGDDFSDIELPQSLANLNEAVAKILSKDSPMKQQMVLLELERFAGNEAYAMAARSGTKLSQETLRKLHEQQEQAKD